MYHGKSNLWNVPIKKICVLVIILIYSHLLYAGCVDEKTKGAAFKCLEEKITQLNKRLENMSPQEPAMTGTRDAKIYTKRESLLFCSASNAKTCSNQDFPNRAIVQEGKSFRHPTKIIVPPGSHIITAWYTPASWVDSTGWLQNIDVGITDGKAAEVTVGPIIGEGVVSLFVYVMYSK